MPYPHGLNSGFSPEGFYAGSCQPWKENFPALGVFTGEPDTPELLSATCA